MYIESFKQHFSAIDDHRQSAKVTSSVRSALLLRVLMAGSRSANTFLVQKTKNVHRWEPC
jgi:hypothetical protein